MTESPSSGETSSGRDRFIAHSDQIRALVAGVCRSKRIVGEDADDFASFVNVKLIEHDFAIFAKFQGRSSISTYLTVVIQRLLLDYRNSAWGKWRPSAAAKRGGPLAVQLEELLVRDGHTFEEACGVLHQRHGPEAERPILERLVVTLPSRLRRRFENDDALADQAADVQPPDEGLDRQEREAAATRVLKALRHVMVELQTQDRLILAMHFADGHTVAHIAGILGLEQKALYRRVERLLRHLRQALERTGVDRASAAAVLNGEPLELDWVMSGDHGEGGIPPLRPSNQKGGQS